jgi:peroxiredoxin Q/BCP
LPRFSKKGVAVLGISILDAKSKAKFAAKHDLTFPLLADADHAVAEKYGVWVEKSMYGRKYMGIERTTFLIDEKGKIAEIWSKVKVPGHVKAVVEALS